MTVSILLLLATYTIAAPLLDDVEVKLLPNDPFPYLLPGADTQARIEIANRGKAKLELKWQARIVRPLAEPASSEQAFALEPDQIQTIELPRELSSTQGVVKIDWKLTDQTGREIALTERLAVMRLPGASANHRDRFRFGWGTSLVHFVDAKFDAEAMKAYAMMGCDLIRVGDRWAYTKPGQPTAAAFTPPLAHTAEIVAAARRNEIDVLYLLWGTPPSAVRKGFSNAAQLDDLAKRTKTDRDDMIRVAPPELDAWRTRVRETVEHFKADVRFWEIWNDQDRFHDFGHHMPNGWVGDTEEYVRLLKESHGIIKSIDPKLQVLTGGFHTAAKDPRHELNPDLHARVIADARDAFDIHASFDTSSAALEGPLAELRKSIPDRPLWITRVEQKHADAGELVRRLVTVKANGAKAFVWMWALDFDSGHRGLLMPMRSWKTPDRKPINQHTIFQMSEAGCAYVHAIGVLREMEPATPARESLGEKVVAFGFRSVIDPHRRLRVLWRDSEALDSEISLPVGPRDATTIDLFGNTRPLIADPRGRITVPVRRDPIYVLTTQ